MKSGVRPHEEARRRIAAEDRGQKSMIHFPKKHFAYVYVHIFEKRIKPIKTYRPTVIFIQSPVLQKGFFGVYPPEISGCNLQK